MASAPASPGSNLLFLPEARILASGRKMEKIYQEAG